MGPVEICIKVRKFSNKLFKLVITYMQGDKSTYSTEAPAASRELFVKIEVENKLLKHI